MHLFYKKQLVAALVFLAPSVALAGPVGGVVENIGKGTTAAQLDVNANRSFDGVGGGDANFALAAFDTAADTYVAADFNGDQVHEVARYTTGTATYIDQNSNHAWDGVGGGDRSFFFAAGEGFQTPVVGDWSMNGNDRWGLYTTGDLFKLDLNDNGTFDGIGGGDANFVLLAGAGVGLPVIGDWSDSGDADAGKLAQPGNNFILDANGNNQWDGVGGGDANFFFAPGQQGAAAIVPLSGNFNTTLDGDEIGIYNPNNDQFLLDLNGNGTWDGNAGGDANIVLSGSSGPGIPVVCDFDGDGDDEVAKVVGTSANWIIDLNGNNQWDGNAGGDFNGFFGPGGGTGVPMCGVWTAAP